jgi:tetratricopeptide (TPR) repeat protein
MREVLESLISGGASQYWAQYLTSAENSHGLQDRQTLDLLRLRLRTGTLRGVSDYELAAELALQVGSPQEAADIMQKGFDAKVLSDNRAQRLLTAAKTAAAKDSANLAAMQKTADAAPSGDADVKLGEELNGFGKYADAISAIQDGIKKGVTDKGNAQVRLGVAYMGAGQHDAAQSAFAKVPKDGGNWPLIAHIWSMYARSH